MLAPAARRRCYRAESGPVEVRAAAERIGTADNRLRISGAEGTLLLERSDLLPDHAAALAALFTWLQSQRLDDGLHAIGPRVVHGGSEYTAPTLITEAVLADLEALLPLDSEHPPQALPRHPSHSRDTSAHLIEEGADNGHHL